MYTGKVCYMFHFYIGFELLKKIKANISARHVKICNAITAYTTQMAYWYGAWPAAKKVATYWFMCG